MELRLAFGEDAGVINLSWLLGGFVRFCVRIAWVCGWLLDLWGWCFDSSRGGLQL